MARLPPDRDICRLTKTEARVGIEHSDCLVRGPGRCQSMADVMAERFQLQDDAVLDARRAVWLPRSRCLAVADLHLGEAWARRAPGAAVPALPSPAGIGFKVKSIAATRALLAKNGVEARDGLDGGVWVAPEHACGAAIYFFSN